jgi:hypothetical protein
MPTRVYARIRPRLFRLRDFFIFAQSTYPSPFASRRRPPSPARLPSPRLRRFSPPLPTVAPIFPRSLSRMVHPVQRATASELREETPSFHGLFRRISSRARKQSRIDEGPVAPEK